MVLMFNFNNYQHVRFLNSSNQITASVYKSFNNIVNYFRLAEINEKLADENARLKNEISIYRQLSVDEDTTSHQGKAGTGKYLYKSARVINNTVYKQNNYFTLNKGRKHGITPDEGIISGKGIVGIISNVSESYSTGLSLLNKRLKISGKLKKNNYFGSVSWDGVNYRYVQLHEIPPPVEIEPGDSVVTSGSSAFFPEGILIGTVESYELKPGESFYTIQVKLAVDFESVTNVEIIENRDRKEILNLEKRTQDDQDLD